MGNIVKPFKQQPSSFAYQPLTVPLISDVEVQNENLRVFSFTEWMKATKINGQDRVVIRDDRYIRFRTFYKCYIDNTTFALSRTKTGTPVSVVEYLHISSQAQQEWVFHVSLSTEEEALPWDIRVKIAIGTAQGLAFLHSIKNTPLHQELRMHNIMFDEVQYNAKLFYLESKSQRLEDETFVGRTEYIPPELFMTGILGMDTDVYTFGVILLELLAGSQDISTTLKNQSLDWTGSFLPDNYKIGEIIDS
ncbi:unnamed protein product [Arabidopsis arenosa]|uniref:Protein kinase domain-containing protein n=1 Tax=Arabidopsis arenosa TaxID=38785 RepID=A0A8S2ASK6_ARAAE|nr:unnamed protein product [Arabidopsis arenosa]